MFFNQKLVLPKLIFVIALVSIFFPARSSADLGNILFGDTIKDTRDDAKRLLGDFLKDLDELSNRLLTRGANEGNLLLIQASNEVNIASHTLSSLLGDQLQKNIHLLSDEFSPLIYRLLQFEEKIDEVDKMAIDLTDLMYLDIENLISKIPGNERILCIRRVKNTTLIRKDKGIYEIDLIGSNFGTYDDKMITDFEFKIDGRIIDTFHRKPPHSVIIEIPTDFLNEKFDNDKIKTASLLITVIRKEKKFLRWKERLLPNAIIRIALLPDKAGTATVITERPVYQWQALRGKETIKKTVRDKCQLKYAVPSRDTDGKPSDGEMKIDKNISVVCRDFSSKRKFPNGMIFDSTHALFVNGWYSRFSIPKIHPDDLKPTLLGAWQSILTNWTMLKKFINEDVKKNFGFTYSDDEYKDRTFNPQKQINNLGKTFYISCSELMSRSIPVGCVEMREIDRQFTEADSKVTVTVGGTASVEVEWILTVQPLTYSQTKETIKEAQTFDVYLSKLLEITIFRTDNSATTIEFQPIVGHKHTIPLGTTSKDLRFVSSSSIGKDYRKYYYEFKYPMQ
jgi:hypothetical protein